MGQTVTEKVVQAHAVGLEPKHVVKAGDLVKIRPHHVLTHDNTSAVMAKFKAIGAESVADPSQPVFALDHNVQDTSEKNLAKYRAIEEFAKKHGIAFHRAGQGIGHQLMVERGFVHPGRLEVASDSHANMYGALSAVGTPVVRTDAAAIWAVGTTWWQVPPTVKVILEGRLKPGVSGKDVILTLCGLYNSGEVLNRAVEFHGDGVASLSMADRLTIANMTTEWGALVGWFPFDDVTASYLRARLRVLESEGITDRLTEEMIREWESNPPAPDPDAEYEAEIVLDLSAVVPQVAGPHTVFAVKNASEVSREELRVQKAYLLSCVNGRLEDLRAAARVLKGRKVAEGVELYVAAASAEIEQQAKEEGTWQVLMEAGAIPLPPGCGACIGLGKGLLEPGERGISATNRNFRGRMGSRDAEAYLASPAVVAESAAKGFISCPVIVESPGPSRKLTRYETRLEAREVQVLEGFPAKIEGRILLLPSDNINTDGIYGKEYTYRDDLTPEEMGSHAMENYDPEFQALARSGDVLVAGANFGTGSSREQAATALKYRGIKAVIAESFSATYLRNAFNNAFLCLSSPALVAAIKKSVDPKVLETRRTIPIEDRVVIDVARSVALWRGSEFPISPLGPTAQELILAGGLEALVRRELAART